MFYCLQFDVQMLSMNEFLCEIYTNTLVRETKLKKMVETDADCTDNQSWTWLKYIHSTLVIKKREDKDWRNMDFK